MGLSETYPAYGGNGPGDLKVGLGLGAAGTIFMLMRVYVRLRVNKFGTTALLWFLSAWFFTTISQAVASVAILHGLGNHIDIVTEAGDLKKLLLFTWITVFMFSVAIPLGKCAACSFLIDMNGQGNPKIRMSLLVVGIINVVLAIPQLVIIWTQCSPPSKLWNPEKPGVCHNHLAPDYLTFVGAVAAASDLYLAIIPAAMLIPLQIDTKLKWGLSFLMGCGIFAAAAAIVRAWSANTLTDSDPSWGSGTLFRWGEIEEWVVLICMSIPPVWPLFRPLTKKFISSRSKSYPTQGPNHTSKGYNQFASSTQNEGTIKPPTVTTTIHISSKQALAAKPADDTSSIESLIGDAPAAPWAHGAEADGSIEMAIYNKQPHYK